MKLINTLKSLAFIALGIGLASSASAATWYQLEITHRYQGNTGDALVQISELALFDIAGNRVGLNLQDAGLNVSAPSLAPGSCTSSGGTVNATDPRAFNLFDGNLSTKHEVRNIGANEELSPHTVVTLRLEADAQVVGYNLASGSEIGNNGQYYWRAPKSWILRSSSDGSNWTVIDSRTAADDDAALTQGCTWYNGGGKDAKPTTAYRVGGGSMTTLHFLDLLAADQRRVDASPYAAGGDLILKEGDDYIHVFTNTAEAATFTAKTRLDNMQVLMVGGGGAGGRSGGGGGGAGGLVQTNGFILIAGNYAVKVGAGAAGQSVTGKGGNGGDSYLRRGVTEMVVTAVGGGGGGFSTSGSLPSGASGGSGGGGSSVGGYGSGSGGAPVSGQGYKGGYSDINTSNAKGAGGGGAGSVGADATSSGGGNGGAGATSSILGYDVIFAGGGGGSANSGSVGKGGVGGGGAAASSTGTAGAGENGLGGGGGGATHQGMSGRGGDGLVVIRYAALNHPVYDCEHDFVNHRCSICGAPEVTTAGTAHALTAEGEQVFVFDDASATSTFTLYENVEAWVLCVAGGGAGGQAASGTGCYQRGGGGGAGGLLESKSVALAAGTYTVTVGRGGVRGASPQKGGDSILAFGATEKFHSYGGGYGGYWSTEAPSSGGSGGGGSYGNSGALGTNGQGHDGGKGNWDVRGGGGGGAGSNGMAGDAVENAGVGGDGIFSDITGLSCGYAGGGGGGACDVVSAFGGGRGAISTSIDSTAGYPGTGGGGGGGGSGADGASGVVIVRILGAHQVGWVNTSTNSASWRPAENNVLLGRKPTLVSGTVPTGWGTSDDLSVLCNGAVAANGGTASVDTSALVDFSKDSVLQWNFDGPTTITELRLFNAWTAPSQWGNAHVSVKGLQVKYAGASGFVAVDIPTNFYFENNKGCYSAILSLPTGAIVSDAVAIQLKLGSNETVSGVGGMHQIVSEIEAVGTSVRAPARDFLTYLATNANAIATSATGVAETDRATGGHIIHSYEDGDDTVYVHIFTNPAAATAFTPKRNLQADVLVVGGGGGAGGASQGVDQRGSGGGGAGGVVRRSLVLPMGDYSITVGLGGVGGEGYVGAGRRGRDSFVKLDGTIFADLLAYGGGGSLSAMNTGTPDERDGASTAGLSGGWSSGVLPTCITGQGHQGGANYTDGAGGGGGGAGANGGDATAQHEAGDGGRGLLIEGLLAEDFYFGGGGGGATRNIYPYRQGVGGLGGGGGGANGTVTGNSGVNGTGGGGGGVAYRNDGGSTGGSGGSGIVMIAYRVPKTPGRFRLVESIYSTTAQVLDTLYCPNAKTWMEADISFVGINGGQLDKNTMIFGTDISEGGKYFAHSGADGGVGWRSFMFNNSVNQVTLSVFDGKEPLPTTISYSPLLVENAKATVVNRNVSGANSGARTATSSTTLCLFGCNVANGELKYYNNMHVRSWKIYESDNGTKGGANQVLVRDFVPVVDTFENNRPGLFDTVEGRFYPSRTGVDFMANEGSAPERYYGDTARAALSSVEGYSAVKTLANGDTVLIFSNVTDAASFTVTEGGYARILVVGGGGNGGSGGSGYGGGGGGAGGVVESHTMMLDAGEYKVVVGGAHQDSILTTSEGTELVKAWHGGNGGVGPSGVGGDGGSGGGGGGNVNFQIAGGTGVSGQGHNGGTGQAYYGHGGGGYSETGQTKNGGAGYASDITGEMCGYACGGGGGGGSGNPGGTGGCVTINGEQIKLGGDGVSGTSAESGVSGTGSGGGGSDYPSGGGAGGSGIVVVHLYTTWAPPIGSEVTISEVTATSAKVAVNVIGIGASDSARAILRWGTTENCTEGAKFLGAIGGAAQFEQTLSGLLPGTNYHVRVCLELDDGTTDKSTPETFATAAVEKSAYANLSGVTGAARGEVLADGSVVYVFTDTNAAAAASFTLSKGGYARLLVVGGGGAGGDHGHCSATGGGGGGQVIDQVLDLAAGTYGVTVGGGGIVHPGVDQHTSAYYPGASSSVRLAGASSTVVEALGGGGGGNSRWGGGSGANGGGGSTAGTMSPYHGAGGEGTVGFAGGDAWCKDDNHYVGIGGGGGGAGGFGGSVMDGNGRGTGGIGLYSSILGLGEDNDDAWFGGGGAGGVRTGTPTVVSGGRGGGADTSSLYDRGVCGKPGTGGGGAGGVTENRTHIYDPFSHGGSGIVVLRIYGTVSASVALNANGGTGGATEVTATVSQPMPTPITLPTRTGYAFNGYVAEDWEVKLMTGNDTDVINDGKTVFAEASIYSAGVGSLNGVVFGNGLQYENGNLLGNGRLSCDKITVAFNGRGFEDKNDTTYGKVLLNGASWNNGAAVDSAILTVGDLKPGNFYLLQFFVHAGASEAMANLKMSVDGENWYYYGDYHQVGGLNRSRYGVTFIRRFKATAPTESMTLYFDTSSGGDAWVKPGPFFNAVQLRDLTDSADVSGRYYNADGTSARTYPANGPTELFALWQPITYTIMFGHNAETEGMLNDLICTYDVPTNLPPNTLKNIRPVYLVLDGGSVSGSTTLSYERHFTKWNFNGHYYDDKAEVLNLTATPTTEQTKLAFTPQWDDPGIELPTPTKTGYNFDGWYNGSTKVSSPYHFYSESSITLTAHWSLATYTVNYALNGGTAGTTHPASVTPGTAFEVSAPTKSGCHFIGWKVSGFASGAKWGTSSDAATTDVTADGLCFNGTSSVWFKSLAAAGGTVTLTAQWRTDVTKPTAATGLVYNGNEQTGVEAATGYSVANGKATNAGDYMATVTLTDGYCWSDGTTANESISWSIAKAAIVASAADVEKEYDGVAAHIAVTVTTPASGATVTYCTTSNGEYAADNPSYSEFGAHRVYWKVTAANYEEANGSAVVRIGKKAAGKFVRLRITQRTGGTVSSHQSPEPGEFSVSLAELALYSDVEGTSRFGRGLKLASDLNNLKKTPGTCFCTLPDREPNYVREDYCGKTIVRLFDENGNTHNTCEGCDYLAEPRTSPNAHLIVYMHLSEADAAKVIRAYDLQSPLDTQKEQNRAPTAWRLEVSSDCERWTVIDEQTVADTAGNGALTQNSQWYGKNGSVNKKPYRINLDYVPMEVLETNPYAEGSDAYKNAKNYIQIVGFRLEADDVVTAKVKYNDDPSPSSDHTWDTIFNQRDSSGKGWFSVFRLFGDQDGGPLVRFDYGDKQLKSETCRLTGVCEYVASAAGLKTNGVDVVFTNKTTCTWGAMPDNSLLLFAADDYALRDGVAKANWAYLKCYYFKVADSTADSTLRLDLVPASNTVSHAQGLYDCVSGNFYPLQAIDQAGKTTLSGSNTKVTFSKELTAIKDETAGWNQFPLVTEVAYSGTYLTSITNYWQQEWVPAAVTGAGEYRLVMRGQGPYKGAVTNVYTVRARVALDANGGTAGATNSVLVLPGKALPNITGAGALPTRVGHVFAGYFDDATGTKYYNADGTCVTGVTYPMADGPTALMAHWLVDLAQAKVLTTAVPVSPWPPAVTVEVGDGSLTRVSTGFAVTSVPETPVVGGSCTLTLTGDGVTCTGTQTATVRVNPAAPDVVSGATMWFDAADAAKLTLSTEAITADEIALGEGVTFVTNWMKSAGEVDHMSALTNYYGKSSGDAVGYVRKGNRPTLGTMTNGNHYLDFGSVLNIAKAAPMPSGYGAGMGWFDENGAVTARSDIRDVYMVVMDDAGCNARLSGSCQYQHFLGSATEDGTSTSFSRLKDYGYVLIDGGISSGHAADTFLNGTVSIDGLAANVRTIYPPGFHVLRFASDGGAGSAGALCSNESDAQGGLKYGELIVFDEVQSDADAAAIIDYLYEKWLGTAPRNDIRIRLDNSAIAAEKITNGFIVCRNGGAMPEVPVKYVDSNDPVTTFVRGTFIGYYDANGVKYYGTDGLPVSGKETCAFTADTTLYAHYAYILPAIRADGPTVEVETGWMKSLCPDATSVNDYKSAFLEPNGNGVKVWQTYVLGFEPGEVSTAAIVEETVQNANPDTVTIRLRGMPAEPRTNATTRLAYSLYAATTLDGLRNGGGTPVGARQAGSSFEAPLDALTNTEPVRYYQIRSHFIFWR